MGMIIRTKDKKVFDSLNQLRFNDQTILPRNQYTYRIVKNINRQGDFLDVQHNSNNIVLRKKNNFKFNLYQ